MIIQYPDSPFYIGFPTIHNEETYIKYTSIMFSRDGIKWTNPIINFFNESLCHTCVYNFVEDLEMKKCYIYKELKNSNSAIECYAIQKHKFGLITSNDNLENWFTLELKLRNNNFYILTDIYKEGYVFIEIFDKNDVLLCISNKIINTYHDFQKILWNTININDTVTVKITFLNAVIYCIKYDLNI